MMKRTVVLMLAVLTLVIGYGLVNTDLNVAYAQQHTELTLKPIEPVKDFYFEYAAQHGWEKLNDITREKAMSEVLSEGAFLSSGSRLYTPRVLWIERMAVADYYFRDFDEAEQEFYDDFYIDPADGIAILAVLSDSNPRKTQDVEFIVRDSTGKVYKGSDVRAYSSPVSERAVFGVTIYDATYNLLVFGDFSEVEDIRFFVLAEGMMGRAEHRWILK